MKNYLFKGFRVNQHGSQQIYINGKRLIGEWVQGCYVYCKDEYCSDINHAIFTSECEHVCMGEYTDHGWYNVIPETVSQFTGLYDEHSKMILENDIVKVRDNLGGMTARVVWNNTFAQFTLEYTIFPLGDFDSFEREVVGNVFENV